MICLPPELTNKFLQAIKSKNLDIKDLSKMSPEERRSVFEGVVGKDNAQEVNTLFESKLALKNQETGMINFIKEVAGLKSEAQRDMIARVSKLDKVLSPTEQHSFLKDLAAKIFNTEVTPEEAEQLTQLAKESQKARTQRDANATAENIRNYGKSKAAFGDYLDSLKKQNAPKFLDAVKGKRFGEAAEIASDTFSDILNIPKSALTSILHFSAAGVQLWGSMTTPQFWKGAVEQFKYFASENAYKDAQADISGHPDYDIAKRAGLGITSIDGKLNDREEAIQSSLLQKLSKYVSDKTKLPDFIRASSRAFTGYLNYVRFGRFEDLLNAARLKGTDVSKGSSATKDFADVVNSFSGRGKLPFNLDKNQAALNTFFFSPRKFTGAVDMFNPATYLDPRIDSTARIAAFKQLTGSLLVTTALLTMGKLMSGQVETNPIGTNFGKVKFGNSTIDLTGGNASYVRLIAQLVSNKQKTSTGNTQTLGGILKTTTKTGKVVNSQFTAPTRADQIESYIRNHTSPVVAALWNWAAGSDPVGNPVSAKSEAEEELTPLVTQAFVDMYKNDRSTFDKIWPLIPSIFGFSTQSNPPVTKKK